MGGDGGGFGGPSGLGTGNVGDIGIGMTGLGFGSANDPSGFAGQGGYVGAGDPSGSGPGTGGVGSTPGWNQGQVYGGTGVLGTPYPGVGTGTTWGTGGTTPFTYPTPQEAANSIYGQPYMQNQNRILGNMESMPAFRAAVLPEVQGVMKTLGRSGLPSSSMADRTITDTMGSLYNKWMWNVLTGYQNIGAQMPSMMNSWYAPYNTMLNYVGS